MIFNNGKRNDNEAKAINGQPADLSAQGPKLITLVMVHLIHDRSQVRDAPNTH